MSTKQLKSKPILQTISNQPTSQITKQVRDSQLKGIFNMYDRNGDGKIANSEISSFFESIGDGKDKKEIKKVLDEIDTDKCGFITFDDFLEYYDKTYSYNDDEVNEVIDAFHIFDYDKNGNISKEEFVNILTKFGDDFSEKDIDNIFDMIDVDHDGVIKYYEFVDMWKYKSAF